MANIKSPCINVCELNSDNICLGCYRSIDVISSWSDASKTDQQTIIDKAKLRRELVKQEKGQS